MVWPKYSLWSLARPWPALGDNRIIRFVGMIKHLLFFPGASPIIFACQDRTIVCSLHDDTEQGHRPILFIITVFHQCCTRLASSIGSSRDSTCYVRIGFDWMVVVSFLKVFYFYFWLIRLCTCLDVNNRSSGVGTMIIRPELIFTILDFLVSGTQIHIRARIHIRTHTVWEMWTFSPHITKPVLLKLIQKRGYFCD